MAQTVPVLTDKVGQSHHSLVVHAIITCTVIVLLQMRSWTQTKTSHPSVLQLVFRSFRVDTSSHHSFHNLV